MFQGSVGIFLESCCTVLTRCITSPMGDGKYENPLFILGERFIFVGKT